MRRKLIIAAVWLALWQLLAMAVNNMILLAGPADTLQALFRMAREPEYWCSIGNTMLRILGGFAAGSVLGILSAALSYRFRLIREFLAPAVTIMKAVPVASFVILVLIWAGNRMLSLMISGFVVFPILYLNTLEGLDSTDGKLLELARTFRMTTGARIRYLYLPQLKPFLKSALRLSAGMSFKSGIAAEVIGQPLVSIGNGLYRAKVWLETADVFAWTVTAILLSWIIERIILKVCAPEPEKGAAHGTKQE